MLICPASIVNLSRLLKRQIIRLCNRCMEMGGDGYFTKPFTVEELLRAVAARRQRPDALRRRFNYRFSKTEFAR